MFIKINTTNNKVYYTTINDVWRAKQMLGKNFISWEKLNSWAPIQKITDEFCGDKYYEWIKGKKNVGL